MSYKSWGFSGWLMGTGSIPFQLLLLNWGNPPGPTGFPCTAAWKLSQGTKLGQHGLTLVYFPFLRDQCPSLPNVQCLENHCFIFFIFLNCFGQKGKFSYSVLVRNTLIYMSHAHTQEMCVCVCVCVYIYIYMSVSIYIHTYTYTHTYIYL